LLIQRNRLQIGAVATVAQKIIKALMSPVRIGQAEAFATMVDNPDTMTLVSTMISLAHSLRLSVVAEGVESEEQAEILRLLRCDQMQGYLIDRPMTFDAMTERLTRGNC
jgi:EAL domain-containing protein (putative c-di-GMP-specific phosphodiesterase class I)